MCGRVFTLELNIFFLRSIIATDGEELENRDAPVVEGLDVCFQLQGI